MWIFICLLSQSASFSRQHFKPLPYSRISSGTAFFCQLKVVRREDVGDAIASLRHEYEAVIQEKTGP